MHEISVLEEIVESVKNEADRYPGYCVGRVRIIIGKLRQFVPEFMRYYYTIITKNSPLEHSYLEVEEIPIQIYCIHCDTISEVDEPEFQCPGCLATDIKMLGGNELILDSIELIENNQEKPALKGGNDGD